MDLVTADRDDSVDVDAIIMALFRAVATTDSLASSPVDGREGVSAPPHCSVRGQGLLSSGWVLEDGGRKNGMP